MAWAVGGLVSRAASKRPETTRADDVLLRVEGVDKRYGSAPALTGVQFQLCKGHITGLIGRNGAGKTTLLRLLAGCIKPSAGHISRQPGVRIGFAPDRDEALYLDQTVVEYLRLMSRLAAPSPVLGPAEVIEMLGLENRAHQEIRTLSRGYRQRVIVGQAFLGAPEIILLDEPLNSLDPTQAADVVRLIQALPWKPAVVISSHVFSQLIEIVHDVAVLGDGRILAHKKLAEFMKPERTAAGELRVRVSVLARADQVRGALRNSFHLDVLEARGGVVTAEIGFTPGQHSSGGGVDELTQAVVRSLCEARIPVVEIVARGVDVMKLL